MPLESLERRQFMTKVRSALLDRVGGGGGYMGGPTGTGGYGMMSGSQPSAGEMGAFNDKKKNRALYGKYGKGGLEREGLRSAETISGIRAGAQTGAAQIGADASRDVAGTRARSDLDVQGLRNKGAIGERKLMEGGQNTRLRDTLGAKRETDMLRFGKGGLEERKLNILEKTKTIPKIHTLDRSDMMGQEAFLTFEVLNYKRLENHNAPSVSDRYSLTPYARGLSQSVSKSIG